MSVGHALARIFYQFLQSRRELVCGLRYVSAHEPQRVKNTPPVASLVCLATDQLASHCDKTGEISGLGLCFLSQSQEVLSLSALTER